VAELLTAVVGAFVELIAAVIQLCIELVALVLESIGFAVEDLAKKPEEGQARFSGKRLMVAFAPLAAILLLIFGTFGIVEWRAEVRQARTLATRTLVEEHLNRLAAQVDKQGRFVQHPAPTLDANDAWGSPLRVAYEETLTHQVIAVRSAGADGKMDTPDDISLSRKRLRPKQEIAMDAFDKVKTAIKKRIEHRD
jgi:hypothetical protein